MPHSTLCTPHSTLYTLHLTLYTPLHTLHFTLYTPHSTLDNQHSTLHTLYFTHYTLHSTLFTRHSILYKLHFTLLTAHCTLYTPHSTLYTLHFTLPLAAASTKPCCKLLLFQRCSLPFASFQKMMPPKRWQRRVAWATVTVGTSGGFYMMAYKLTLYLIWAFMELALTIFLLPYFSLRILEPPKGWMRWSMWEDCCNGL